MYAYAHEALGDETFGLTRFASVEKFFAFVGRFHGLKGPPKFFTQKNFFFKKIIHRGSALICIDGILLITDCKSTWLHLIQQLHITARETDLRVFPQEPSFMLFLLKSLVKKPFNTFYSLKPD